MNRLSPCTILILILTLFSLGPTQGYCIELLRSGAMREKEIQIMSTILSDRGGRAGLVQRLHDTDTQRILIDCLFVSNANTRVWAFEVLLTGFASHPSIVEKVFKKLWSRDCPHQVELIRALGHLTGDNPQVRTGLVAGLDMSLAEARPALEDVLIPYFHTNPDVQAALIKNLNGYDKFEPEFFRTRFLQIADHETLFRIISTLNNFRYIAMALAMVKDHPRTDADIEQLITLVEPGNPQVENYLKLHKRRATLDQTYREADVQARIDHVRLEATRLLASLPYAVTRPDLVKRIKRLRTALPGDAPAEVHPAGAVYRAPPQTIDPSAARTEALRAMRRNLNLVRFELPEAKLLSLLRTASTPEARLAILNRIAEIGTLSSATLVELIGYVLPGQTRKPGVLDILKRTFVATDTWEKSLHVDLTPEVRSTILRIMLAHRKDPIGSEEIPSNFSNLPEQVEIMIRKIDELERAENVRIDTDAVPEVRVRVAPDDAPETADGSGHSDENHNADDAELIHCAADNLRRGLREP